MITSPGNARIKDIVKLQTSAAERNARGLFVVEGRKLVSEAPKEALREIYVTEDYIARYGADFPCPVETVTEEVFRKISDTRSPQGILAVAAQRQDTFESLLSKGPVLVLQTIQDPGNLGTMLRTGEGAGIGGILTDRDTVDRYNPKVIRSTMGSIYRVPLFAAEDLPAAIQRLKQEGYALYAAHLKGRSSYTDISYPEKTAFLVGNEGNGLSDEIADLADTYIRIPMEGQVESLNAAVSAVLLAYEWHRQRL